jgi:hypothetical protein
MRANLAHANLKMVESEVFCEGVSEEVSEPVTVYEEVKGAGKQRGSGGLVFTFGKGKDGELGNGGRSKREILPFQMGKLKGIRGVSNGG